MQALRAVWPWARPYWRYMAAALVGTVASVVINLMIPLQTSRVIDDGIAVGDRGLVRNTVVIMIVLIIAGAVVSALTSIMAVRLAFNTATDLRSDLHAQTQRLGYANLDTIPTGGLLTRFTADITRVTMVLTMALSFIAQAPLMFIGSLVAIVSIDVSLSVVVLFMVPVIGLMVWYVLARSGRLYDAVQTRLDRLNTVLQENIEGAEVIKAFVRQDHEIERFDRVADDLADQSIAVNQLVASLLPTLTAVSTLGVAAVVWLGGGNVIDGTLSEGNLVAFISYMTMVTMPMMMFAFIQPVLSAGGASMARIQQVFDETPAITEASNAVDLDAVAEPGRIAFDRVTFQYDADADDATLGDALTNIDLAIEPGQMVAILGATGSGKSTLVHLIARLYDATSGTVTIGGVDVRRIDLASLRRHVGIALQEPELFSGTVMENLRFGHPGATADEVVAAARMAQAHEFISEMPDGYDAMVAQSGANLSGGQRQRLAIARTLLGRPSILVLDDSTSAVDLETEAAIQDALATITDQTVVIVAQRISTALGADRIVVLDEGRVRAYGTHTELLETSELYREIHRSQLGEPSAL